MERLDSVGRPGAVGRFSPQQIAQISTWGVVPDDEMTMASLHAIHVVPKNGSTETLVNPLDPGPIDDRAWYDHTDAQYDKVKPVGKRLV